MSQVPIRSGNAVISKSARLVVCMAVLVVAFAQGGCAKSPTVILTHVDVDDTVPPILVLRWTVTSVGDSTKVASSSFWSLAIGDATDRPAPYTFPIELPVAPPASLAGAVTVVVEGLDFDTQAVVARGSASAQLVSEQQTRASLTMTAVAASGGDAGTVDGDGTDGPDTDGSGASDGGAASGDVPPDL